MNRAFRTLLVVITLVLVAAVGSGCSAASCDTSDPANPPTWYEGGKAINGIYASSSSHGPLLRFPGGQRYDLVHHLGFEPVVVQLYWSFHQNGIDVDAQSGDAGTLTLASGNSAIWQLKNDGFIRVKNDSCVEFWLLAIAWGDQRPPSDGGAGGNDAGADVALPFELREVAEVE